MKDTATNASPRRGKAQQPNYAPDKSLDEFLEMRDNEVAFATFVETFLKPAYSTKWRTKRFDQTIKKIADIVTVCDEAFVLLTLENNWDRWIDINNKAKNMHTPSTRGKKETAIDSDVMPKCTHINKKRTNYDSGDDAPLSWKGWNYEGILRYNELCKEVKEDRKQNSSVDKNVLAQIEPQESSRRPRKRRKKLEPLPKPYVESDNDASDDNSVMTSQNE